MSLEIEAGPTPEELEEQRHQEMLKQETRRKLEDEQFEKLREKKRLSEAAAKAR